MKAHKLFSLSLREVVFVVLVCDVVAVVVALNVVDERLEVEVGQLVHHVEHDVFKELVIELWRARENCQVATVLGQASVHNGVVVVISLNDSVLEPLVTSVADKALATWQVCRTVHLSMAAIVRSKSGILSDCVLHEAAPVVHLRVDDLAARPLVCSEGCLINVANLIPGAHEVLLFELLLKRHDVVADDVLRTDLAIVDRLKGLRDGHGGFLLNYNYYNKGKLNIFTNGVLGFWGFGVF